MMEPLWIEHDGGECPLPLGVDIEIAFSRMRRTLKGKSNSFGDWRWTGHNDDIIAYRLLSQELVGTGEEKS